MKDDAQCCTSKLISDCTVSDLKLRAPSRTGNVRIGTLQERLDHYEIIRPTQHGEGGKCPMYEHALRATQ